MWWLWDPLSFLLVALSWVRTLESSASSSYSISGRNGIRGQRRHTSLLIALALTFYWLKLVKWHHQNTHEAGKYIPCWVSGNFLIKKGKHKLSMKKWLLASIYSWNCLPFYMILQNSFLSLLLPFWQCSIFFLFLPLTLRCMSELFMISTLFCPLHTSFYRVN